MKKDKLYVCGSLALFAWIAMTYFLFVHRPQEGRVAIERDTGRLAELNSLKSRMSNFEFKLKENIDQNGAFLRQLQEILLQSRNSNSKPKSDKISSKTKEEKNSLTDAEIKTDEKIVIPVLMFACNRVTINRALDNLLKIRKDKDKFPIIVSQVNHNNIPNQI
jgi:alpha-1,3-mannosyl-glycoprotein beta-1,2-N-acetylglucosaminyltransferase